MTYTLDQYFLTTSLSLVTFTFPATLYSNPVSTGKVHSKNEEDVRGPGRGTRVQESNIDIFIVPHLIKLVRHIIGEEHEFEFLVLFGYMRI